MYIWNNLLLCTTDTFLGPILFYQWCGMGDSYPKQRYFSVPFFVFREGPIQSMGMVYAYFRYIFCQPVNICLIYNYGKKNCFSDCLYSSDLLEHKYQLLSFKR